MKKVFSLVLALIMLFSLCACTKTEDKTVEPTNIATEEVKEIEFTFGETNGNTYTNAFLGLGYEKDDSWVYYTEEQINEINNVALDMTTEEVEELINNATILYVMYTSDELGLNNINVNLEKLEKDVVDELNIPENYEQIIPILEDAFMEMGCTNFNYQQKKISIDGEEIDALKTEMEISGAKMYQLIFQKKCGEYLANITITTCLEDTTDSLLDNFFLV